MQKERNRLRLGSVFALACIGLAGACVSAQKPPPTTPEIQALTEGKFLREAVNNLQKRSFQCGNSEAVFIEDEKNRKDYIQCDGSWNISPFVWRKIQVALYSKEGRVYEALVANAVSGP